MDTTPKQVSTRYLEQMLEATRLGNKIQNVKWAERNYQEYSSLSKYLYEDPEIRQRLDIEVARFAEVANNSFPVENLKSETCHAVCQEMFEIWCQSAPSPLNDFAVITVGDVRYQGQSIYGSSKTSVKKLVKAGFDPDAPLNVHVWLTFASGLILDLTIVHSLRMKGYELSADLGNLDYVLLDCSEQTELEYYPILIDNNFMYTVDRLAM